ncbi:DMT family transporter [Tabrizicola piscis]|uniref:DMT family transporter n=1 Tax=Tabrizicola piscis TaxID=2494374 RepID=A0A3S8U7V5_9RHOB|nr:DMT family transporter [Tabrizicola piscis]AZL59736.1 DMT family transporter [Tabrizicola piscis]
MRLFLLVALTMLAFAGNSVLNRWAVGPGHIGAVEFASLRLLAGAVVLATLVLWHRQGLAWPGRQGRLAGVLGLSAYLLGFSLAYRGLDAGTGALVLFGMVQVTMFAGALWSREAVPLRRWVGAGVALGGLALIAAPGGAGLALGPFAMMALAGVGWGIYSLAGRGATDPLAATAWNFLLAVPIVLPLGLVAGFARPDATGVWLAVVSGAVTSGLGYALWYAVLPRLGAARAAVAQLSVPVLAALGGAALLAEVPGLRFWLASGLVLGGVALASLPYRSLTRR